MFKMFKSQSRFWSACLGNLFEHYDTALFGFLSPFLAPLFFPKQDPITALILTYSMIPMGMLARPIGSLVFGYIGDRYGRKNALFLTLSGMAVVSALIAACPTHAQVGFFAPALLCLGRILQNFLAAGETMGGAIFLLENTEEKHHDLLSSLYNASTIGGILLASAGAALLSYYHVIEGGWRLLYVFGCITALFGCLLRRNVEIPNAAEPSTPSITKTLKIFWEYRNSLLLIAIVSGLAYANYSVALVVMNGFVPLISDLTKEQMIALNTSLLVFDFAILPFFGWLASKVSREKVMIGSALAIAISAIPLFLLLKGATLLTVIGVRICFVVLGVSFFASFHAWSQQLIPPAHRYLLISFGYALGSQLFGGPTAALTLWAFKQTGSVSSAAWYWIALALTSSLGLLLAARSRQKALST
ncbi:MAG: MFS transporter [Chlamydiales bacterium]|nr:MFS transporter [Chlamydiales bacterium]